MIVQLAIFSYPFLQSYLKDSYWIIGVCPRFPLLFDTGKIEKGR